MFNIKIGIHSQSFGYLLLDGVVIVNVRGFLFQKYMS
jgi:hypothetical protein